MKLFKFWSNCVACSHVCMKIVQAPTIRPRHFVWISRALHLCGTFWFVWHSVPIPSSLKQAWGKNVLSWEVTVSAFLCFQGNLAGNGLDSLGYRFTQSFFLKFHFTQKIQWQMQRKKWSHDPVPGCLESMIKAFHLMDEGFDSQWGKSFVSKPLGDLLRI